MKAPMHLSLGLMSLLAIFLSNAVSAASPPLILGLDADMSSGSAKAGVAIRRGAEIAIDEINTRGGVLNRTLKLIVRDHRGNPARGVDNIVDFSEMQNLVAVLGGLHTPVALHELKTIHDKKVIYLSPWAAGTPIVENGYAPNFVFRVSVRDQYAGGFLTQKATSRGFRRVALALENTGWGRSNERAMKAGLLAQGLTAVGVSWFHWGRANMSEALNDLQALNPDVILLVANAPEGVAMVKRMAAYTKDRRIPIISHWGITGGQFFQQARDALKAVDFTFLQTFSFLKPPFPDRANRVVNYYLNAYPDVKRADDIFAPTGTAHAYDLVHLLAQAVLQAGTADRDRVRQALENLDEYQGLLKNYAPAFTVERHDALNAGDFRLSRFNNVGVIVPVE